MPRLLLATPEGQQVVELRAFNSLGRHPSNTIQLLDKIVSKEHCIVERRGNEFVLRDLGSLNGTYINGERVTVGGEQMLRHGDDIALGSTRARFDDGSGKPVAPPVWSPAPATPGGPGSPPMVAAPPPAWQPAAPVQQPSLPPASHQRPVPMSAVPATTPATPGMVPQLPLSLPGPGSVTSPGQYQAYNRTPTLDDPEAHALPPLNATRVNMNDQSRAIGTQIAATQKGFLPYDQLAGEQPPAPRRLRATPPLSRAVARDRPRARPSVLLNKILLTIFKFVRADRGVIFLRDSSGELRPGASLRRDGTDSPISVSSTILNHVIKERATVLTHDAAMDFAASKGKSMILNRISSAIVVPLLHNDDILGVLWLDTESLAQFQPKDLEIVTAVAAQAAMFIEINILGKKIEQEIITRERFSRLLSPNIAERVLSGELEVNKGGQLVAECTVFNSDIRGFTRMSEGTQPEIIVEMLNEYFELMVETLFKYEGTLDKFMGDGIMALWGAPVVHPDDPTRSVACAIEQMEVLGRFNRARVGANLPPLGVGIGIHTGPLVAGYIGSSLALSYTVIGDVANTSARLCGVAAAGQILVSEQTLGRLSEKFEYEELPPAQLKGKGRPFRIFNVLGRATAVQVPASVG